MKHFLVHSSSCQTAKDQLDWQILYFLVEHVTFISVVSLPVIMFYRSLSYGGIFGIITHKERYSILRLIHLLLYCISSDDEDGDTYASSSTLSDSMGYQSYHLENIIGPRFRFILPFWWRWSKWPSWFTCPGGIKLVDQPGGLTYMTPPLSPIISLLLIFFCHLLYYWVISTCQCCCSISYTVWSGSWYPIIFGCITSSSYMVEQIQKKFLVYTFFHWSGSDAYNPTPL